MKTLQKILKDVIEAIEHCKKNHKHAPIKGFNHGYHNITVCKH